MSSPSPNQPPLDAETHKLTESHHADAGRSLKKIARSGSANLLGSGFSAASGFVVVVLVSRSWEPHTAGLFFAISSVFIIAIAVSQLGVDQGLVRFIAWNLARNTGSVNRHLVITGVSVSLCVNAALVTAAIAFARPLATLLTGGTPTEETVGMVVVFALALPVAASYELLLATTRGLAHMRPTVYVERILRPAIQLMAVLGVAALGGNGIWLACAWAGPYLVAIVCISVALARVVRKSPDLFSPGSKLANSAASSEFWRFTIPRGISRIALVALQRADIAVVTIVAGPSDAALYTVVTRFLVLGQLATSAIQQVSEPQLAALLAKGNIAGTRRVTQQLTLWSLALAWPIYLTSIVFADSLLTYIFGPIYSAGAPALQVLGVAMLFSSAMGPLDMLLYMAGRSTQSLVNTVTALAVDVAGCFLLIPHIGILGAAVAWLAAIVLRNSLCFFQVRKTLGITPTSRDALFMMGATVIIFIVFPLLGRRLLPTGLLAEVAILATACLCFAATVYWKRRALSPQR